MADHPSPLPHGPITEVFPDVFFVTGGFAMNSLVRITRNMTIVRRGTELVILNSVRLTPEGEAQLAKLGRVAHVVRLGAFHGLDDPYYSERYGVPVWAPRGVENTRPVKEARELTQSNAPLDGASVFLFEKGRRTEAALVLAQDGGVLVACDAYQNWTTFDGCSIPAKIALTFMGFGPTLVGGPWTKSMGPAVREDLERLTQQPFRHLISAHGTVLRDAAKEGLHTAIRNRFG